MTPSDIVNACQSRGRVCRTRCGDGEMVWHLWGSGHPVVLLHGGMGSWMHWIKNIEALRETFTLVVPDLPGHMESAMPPEPHTAELVADILHHGVTEIIGDAAAFSVVGFSLGGALGGHLARLGGERTRTLVLVSSGGLGLRRGPMAPMQRWRSLPSQAERLAAHRQNLQIGMISNPLHIDDLALHVQATSAQNATFAPASISLSDTLQNCLPQIRARLAGIWGAHDPASAPYMEERFRLFRALQPDAPLVVIDDASHWVQYEAAAAFNDAVLAILR